MTMVVFEQRDIGKILYSALRRLREGYGKATRRLREGYEKATRKLRESLHNKGTIGEQICEQLIVDSRVEIVL